MKDIDYYFKDSSSEKISLFCLHHAGGNAEFFLPWKQHLPQHIQLCPIQLPGRSFLSHIQLEPNFNNISKLIAQTISKHSENSNFILFGHSMGAMLAFHVSHLLTKQPLLLCLSGLEAPLFWNTKAFSQRAYKSDLLKWMIQNYYPDLSNTNELAEALNPFVETLRNDLLLCVSHQLSEIKKFEGKVLIFNAQDDELIDHSKIAEWINFCPQVNLINFQNGGHFFLRVHTHEIIRYISEQSGENK
jgi:medium-chain acyl-[acyl-carrier-protein] hydrolase